MAGTRWVVLPTRGAPYRPERRAQEPVMPWIILIIAGLFEVIWASLLPATDGFTRWLPTAGFVASLGLSMYLLSVATRTIPIGTGYAVWVGIGALGAFIVGVVVKGDETNPAQVLAMGLLVAAIVAVKVTSAH